MHFFFIPKRQFCLARCQVSFGTLAAPVGAPAASYWPKIDFTRFFSTVRESQITTKLFLPFCQLIEDRKEKLRLLYYEKSRKHFWDIWREKKLHQTLKNATFPLFKYPNGQDWMQWTTKLPATVFGTIPRCLDVYIGNRRKWIFGHFLWNAIFLLWSFSYKMFRGICPGHCQ